MRDFVIQTVISGFIALLINGAALHFIERYFDKRAAAEETKAQERDEQRKARIMAESERRHAEGRLFFWIYKGVVKPPPNGELDGAMRDFEEIESKQRAIEQAILADFEKNSK